MNVLVTGAARGLGYSLCELLAGNGYTVYAGVRPQSSNAEIKVLCANEPRIKLLDLDVTDEPQVISAAKLITDECGTLDAVVSNAGVLCDSDRTLPITECDLGDLRLALEVNIVGAAAVIKHFHKLVKPNGVFITITSEAGSTQNAGTLYSAYGVSKAGENKLVSIFRALKPPYGVYAVHPGRMNTDMGRATAQIEPEAAALGIYGIIAGKTAVQPENGWFIDYNGCAMPV